MKFIILAVLILTFIFLCAYTIRFQRAIITTGKRISKNSGDCVSNELIDILTPKSQIVRNIINYILIVAIFVLGTVIYSWYLAASFLISSLCILSPLVSILFPKPDDPHYLKSIKKGLMKLSQIYRTNGYASVYKQIYLKDIMSKLRDLEHGCRYSSSNVDYSPEWFSSFIKNFA